MFVMLSDSSLNCGYMGTDLEGDQNIYALSVDPLQGFIGLGYRW